MIEGAGSGPNVELVAGILVGFALTIAIMLVIELRRRRP